MSGGWFSAEAVKARQRTRRSNARVRGETKQARISKRENKGMARIEKRENKGMARIEAREAKTLARIESDKTFGDWMTGNYGGEGEEGAMTGGEGGSYESSGEGMSSGAMMAVGAAGLGLLYAMSQKPKRPAA